MALLLYVQKQVDSTYLPLKERIKVFPLPLTFILPAPHVGSQYNKILRHNNSSAEKEKTENVNNSRGT